MNKSKREKLSLVPLTLVSLAVVAATVGDFTNNSNDCSSSGLDFTSVGTGTITASGTFLPGSGNTVFQCTSGIENVETMAQENVIRNFTNMSFEHILTAAPAIWNMDTGLNVNSGNKIAASSDDNDLGLAFWGGTSITQISEDQGNHFDIDIYQFTGGFDKAIGDLFLGSALSYAHTENEAGNTTSTSETVGFTPYLAYKLNDYLFVSGLAGYLYTHTNRVDGGIDIDTHQYITEGNMNAYKVINSFILKARAGLRYQHTISSPEKSIAGRDNSFDELTWLGDIEGGYMINNKFRIFTGLLYEYFDREGSGASKRSHDSIAFMRYGAEYSLSSALSVNAKVQHDINDEDSDYISGDLNFRLAF